MKEKQQKFTKWISLGWWSSFIFFIGQSCIIEWLGLAATPWLGLMLFASFTILTFASLYDKKYRFSPYHGFMRMLEKSKK